MTVERPTILQIIPRLDTGGAERTTIEIAGAIVAAGGRALVATAGGRMLDQLSATGAEVISFPADTKNPARMLANAGRLAGIIAAEGVDIIHARSRAPGWSALAAARRTHRPFVTTYHGAYGEKGRAKALYNSVMARGDVVIANSEYTARLIQSRYATPADRIATIPRGIDPAAFEPTRIDPARIHALRDRWGVGRDAPLILQVARLAGWKGQSVLIDAAGLLQAQGRLDDAVIILAGDAQGRDDYVGRLEAQIARYGLANRVRLIGHVDDVAAAYATAQVTVIASTEPEAFGRATIEAQAAACPVIVTRLGAPPEAVLADNTTADGATGWIVPPGDATAMANSLAIALALSPQSRQLIGATARAHVIAHFTLAAMSQATLAVYDRLIGSSLAARLRH